jgi:hypothetical protein
VAPIGSTTTQCLAVVKAFWPGAGMYY